MGRRESRGSQNRDSRYGLVSSPARHGVGLDEEAAADMPRGVIFCSWMLPLLLVGVKMWAEAGNTAAAYSDTSSSKPTVVRPLRAGRNLCG